MPSPPSPSQAHPIMTYLNSDAATAILAVLLALGAYAKGFRDGSMLSRGLVNQINFLLARVQELEHKVQEIEDRYQKRVVLLEEELHAKEGELIVLRTDLANQTMINNGLLREIEERKAKLA